MAASQTLSVFDDLDSFEEYWSGILSDAPLREFVACFPHKTRIMGYWEDNHRSKVQFSSHVKHARNQYDLFLLILVLITWLR